MVPRRWRQPSRRAWPRGNNRFRAALARAGARIHLHQPLVTGGLGGQATDIDIQARELLRTRDVVNDIIALHTGQPPERIRQDTDRDIYFSADDAKTYGIIDEVLKLQDWRRRGQQEG